MSMRTRKNVQNFVQGNGLEHVCMLARLVPRFPSCAWSDVFLVSRLSTKCNDTLGHEKQMASSGWVVVLSPSHIDVCKIVVFQRKISY